eukprot:10623230-Alexandrium_andersonii.AAC.2
MSVGRRGGLQKAWTLQPTVAFGLSDSAVRSRLRASSQSAAAFGLSDFTDRSLLFSAHVGVQTWSAVSYSVLTSGCRRGSARRGVDVVRSLLFSAHVGVQTWRCPCACRAFGPWGIALRSVRMSGPRAVGRRTSRGSFLSLLHHSLRARTPQEEERRHPPPPERLTTLPGVPTHASSAAQGRRDPLGFSNFG